LRLYRICRHAEPRAAFDGSGARDYPGRWNTAGTSLVYTAGSRALAILEVLVHTDSDLMPRLWLYEVTVPPAIVVGHLDTADLPAGWDALPHGGATQELGSAWVAEASSVILRVPSVVSLGDFNYPINPRHPSFAKLVIGKPEPYLLDPRLRR
jgi:RES domain-containing protein